MTLLGVAECVHGDHDTGLTRLGGASKVDGAGVGLGLEIVKTSGSVKPGVVIHAGFDVRLGWASPGGHRYLRRRTLGTTAHRSRLVHVDIGLCPRAETDEGSRSSRGRDACSGHREHQVHRGVKVEEKHHGRACVGEESHEEENDAVLEEELPEGRSTRGQDETDDRNDKDDEVDEHGY